MTLKALTIEEKIDRLDYIKVKNEEFLFIKRHH